MRVIDWQVDCRQGPCRRNKLSSSSSIICVGIHASCQPSLPPSQHCMAGGWRGARQRWSISCPPLGALIEKFGWPCLFVLVECGGLCFLPPPPSVLLLYRLWGESSFGGDCVKPHFSLTPVCSQSAPPGSHLPADSLAGPLTAIRPGWTDRQRSSGPGNQATAQLEKTSSVLMVKTYLL